MISLETKGSIAWILIFEICARLELISDRTLSLAYMEFFRLPEELFIDNSVIVSSCKSLMVTVVRLVSFCSVMEISFCCSIFCIDMVLSISVIQPLTW